MKRTVKLLAVALLAATLLTGCVVVPYGGWYGWDYHPYHYYGGYHYYHRWER